MVFWLDHAHGIGVWVKVHTARWCNLTSPAKINNHCPESFFHLLGWWIHPSIKVDHMPIFYPVLWGYPVWSLRCHRNKKTSPCTGMQLHMRAVSCRTCQWPGAQSDPKMIPTHQNHLVQMKNKLPEQTWSATVQWWKLCHFRNLQAALLAKGLTRSYSFVEPPHQLEMIWGLHRPTYRRGGEVHEISCHFLQLKKYWYYESASGCLMGMAGLGMTGFCCQDQSCASFQITNLGKLWQRLKNESLISLEQLHAPALWPPKTRALSSISPHTPLE